MTSTLIPACFIARHEPEVAHAGHHDGVGGELPLPLISERQHADDAVAVDLFAVRVAEDDPVRIAVERDSGIGPMLSDKPADVFRIERAAAVVDIEPVRTDRGLDDLGAEFAEDQRRDRIAAPFAQSSTIRSPRRLRFWMEPFAYSI